MNTDPTVVVTISMALLTLLSNAILATVFIVKMGGKIDLTNATLGGKIDSIDARVQHVETSIVDLKNTDRRLALIEDRIAVLSLRQGNIEKDNLLIREDLNTLRQGLDRHNRGLDKFNDGELSR